MFTKCFDSLTFIYFSTLRLALLKYFHLKRWLLLNTSMSGITQSRETNPARAQHFKPYNNKPWETFWYFHSLGSGLANPALRNVQHMLSSIDIIKLLNGSSKQKKCNYISLYIENEICREEWNRKCLKWAKPQSY